jgi:hypothetical protein
VAGKDTNEDVRQAGEVEPAGHRHERPEQWGWHAEMGTLSRVSAFLVAVVLCLMVLTTHERHIEDIWLFGIAAVILGTLVWDRRRRRNAWRS